MKGQPVSKWAVLLWESLLFACWAILMLLSAVLLVAFPDIKLALFVLFTFAAMIYAVVIIPLHYRSIRWLLTDQAVYLRRGLFIRTRSMIKRERISFVTLRQTPFTPVFGICSVAVYAAGASMVIPFLKQNTARELTLALCPDNEVPHV